MLGRITPQPIRVNGKRPWKRRSNARGTSATNPGKRCWIAGGGSPRVVVAGQTTTAPLAAMSCGVTHGDSAGVAKNSRLGRLGAVSATRAAVCVSPVTTASGRPVRRSKLSAKKRPISAAGCATLRSTANVHGKSSNRDRHDQRRQQQQHRPGVLREALVDDADAVRRQDNHRQRREHGQRRREEIFHAAGEQRGETDRSGRQQRKAIDERPCIRIDGRALNLGGGTARRQREAAGEQHQHDETGVTYDQQAKKP